jgi:hypothetical protein
MNFRCTALWILFGCTSAACSPGPVPISQSPRDPSNPSAPEGVAPPSAMNDTGDAGAAVYACPMHPEVTAPVPGRCPKCGMNLVPRK